MYKFIISALLSSLAASSFADTQDNLISEAETALLYHAQTTADYQAARRSGQWARATPNFYVNNDKTKIDTLYGQWQLNYTDTSPHSDILALESTLSSTDFGWYGWDGTHGLSCFYEPGIVGTSYSYQCLHLVDATSGIAQRYLFNLSGNTLTGKYYRGTIEGFFDSISKNKLLDLKGTKTNASNESDYNDTTKELYIPKVNALGKQYNALLIHEGNGVFRLKTLNPL